MKTVSVIGSGFSSIAAATVLADRGMKVTVFEKNDSPGGRARQFEQEGFVFDMGPSWYWMPDVFEKYFERFNKKTSDYYELLRLHPSYRVFFEDEQVDVPATMNELRAFFESREAGAANRLDAFLKDAEKKYNAGINDLVYKPGLQLSEFARWDVLKGLLQMDLLSNFSGFARKYFRDPKLLSIIEFPVLFLGAMPAETPALYSLMNYADLKLGTWYPMGGMYKVVEAMVKLAEEKGVEFRYNEPARKVWMNGRMGITTPKGDYKSDFVISGADYHHTETNLINPVDRQYTDQYWESRTMAPSALLYYVGVNKKVKGLLHHNLFFDAPFLEHATEIYKEASWPSNPLFYVCCPSKTDASVAAEGTENLFILIPLAPGLSGDTEAVRQEYFGRVMQRIEQQTGEQIREHVVYQKSYSVSDFKSDYNAFKGNAYGLANTLRQTALLKPRIRHKKMKNLYFTGQLTTPGPGMPPSLISGQVVADYILKHSN